MRKIIAGCFIVYLTTALFLAVPLTLIHDTFWAALLMSMAIIMGFLAFFGAIMLGAWLIVDGWWGIKK